VTQLQQAPAEATATSAGADVAARGGTDNRPPLDSEVAASLTSAPHAPYVRAAVVVVAAVVAIEVAAGAITHLLGRGTTGRAALSLIAELLVGAAAIGAAVPVVRRVGGWRSALGFDRPRRGDAKTTAAWFGIQVATRMSVAYLLIICVPPLRHQHISNLTGLSGLSAPGLVMVFGAAVVVAPVAEELMMRGLVLRASMRAGMAFWPAAALNGVIFGGLHAHEGSTMLAAVVLAVSTGAFGVVQCVLVRRQARLAPAIGVHATTNLVALALVLVTSAAH
jgi:membrane protease YdiL (CAAX protease family)